MEIQKWGKKDRITKCLKTLETYGTAATSVLPELRHLEKDLRSHSEARMLAPMAKQVHSLIEQLDRVKQDANDNVELRSISDP